MRRRGRGCRECGRRRPEEGRRAAETARGRTPVAKVSRGAARASGKGGTTHQLVDCARVHLEVQVPRDRVLPAHGQRLDVLVLPRRQVVERHFGALGLHPESGRPGTGAPHPDVGMWSIADLCPDRERLEVCGEDVKHDLAADERRPAERHLQLVACAVVVPDRVALGRRHLQAVQRRNLGRVALVQSCVDVPPVKAREPHCRVVVADSGAVERLVARVPELARVGESLQDVLVRDEPVANQLDLGAGDRAQVGVEDALGRLVRAADLRVRVCPLSGLRATEGQAAARTLPCPYSCASGSNAFVRACCPAGVKSTSSKTTTPCL